MLQHTLIFLNLCKSMDAFSLLRYGKDLNTAIYSKWGKLHGVNTELRIFPATYSDTVILYHKAGK